MMAVYTNCCCDGPCGYCTERYSYSATLSNFTVTLSGTDYDLSGTITLNLFSTAGSYCVFYAAHPTHTLWDIEFRYDNAAVGAQRIVLARYDKQLNQNAGIDKASGASSACVGASLDASVDTIVEVNVTIDPTATAVVS